jgi:hypothetical protein
MLEQVADRPDTRSGSLGWILSAHGGYERWGVHEVFLDDVAVYYFCDDERSLSNARAWPLFHQLLAPNPDLPAVHAAAPHVSRERSYVYRAWGAREFPSGIFEVGCGSADRPLFPLAPDEGIDLTEIVGHPRFPGTLYWLACRNYTPVNDLGLRYHYRGRVCRNNLCLGLWATRPSPAVAP